jgi:hypothetical protein
MPGVYRNICLYFVPKRWMKFIFSALYRVTQKVFFMNVSTLKCGHLLLLNRYLYDFQAFATCLSARGVL